MWGNNINGLSSTGLSRPTDSSSAIRRNYNFYLNFWFFICFSQSIKLSIRIFLKFVRTKIIQNLFSGIFIQADGLMMVVTPSGAKRLLAVSLYLTYLLRFVIEVVFSTKLPLASFPPGLTSIQQKCLSYNSIHQVCGKMLVIQFSYNFEKRY